MRFAPLYDAVTTRVFPGLARDRLALKLNGKDDRLTREDFVSLARTIEFPAPRAREILREIDEGLSQALAEGLTLPGETRAGEAQVLQEVAAIIAERLRATAPQHQTEGASGREVPGKPPSMIAVTKSSRTASGRSMVPGSDRQARVQQRGAIDGPVRHRFQEHLHLCGSGAIAFHRCGHAGVSRADVSG